MSISIQCPGCRQRYKVDAALVGKKVQCQRCGERIPVAAPEAAPLAQRVEVDEYELEERAPAAKPVTPFATEIEVDPAPAKPATAKPANPKPAGSKSMTSTEAVPHSAAEIRGAASAPVLAPLTAPLSGPVQSDAILDMLSEDDRGATLAAFGSSSLGSLGMALDRLEWKIRRRLDLFPQGFGLARFAFTHKLAVAVTIWAVVAFVDQSLSHGFLRGAIFGGVGVALAWALLEGQLGRNVGVKLAGWAYLVFVLGFPLAEQYFRPAVPATAAQPGAEGEQVAEQPGALWPTSRAGRSKRKTDLFDTTAFSLPRFPERGPMQALAPGVNLTRVTLEAAPNQAGFESAVSVYLPSGSHAERSLPCVFMAPSGTNLLTGARQTSDAEIEHIPWAKAGCAVIAYDIDGALADPENPSDDQRAHALRQFAHAEAGLVNARNALEYALARFPEIDPQRLIAAGHSSAGTLALLFAEHDPRIKACVALAAVSDVEQFLSLGDGPGRLTTALPEASIFIARSSPHTHEAQLTCPVFLYHGADDVVVPQRHSKELAARLLRDQKRVKLVAPDRGDHGRAPIDEGIPQAIQWLRGLGLIRAESEPVAAASKPAVAAAPSETPLPMPEKTTTTTTTAADPFAAPAASQRPANDEFRRFADSAFTEGNAAAGLKYLYADALASDKSAVWAGFRWNKTLGRALVGIRWGVGVEMDDAAAEASGRLNAPAGHAPQDMLTVQQQRAAEFSSLTGELGQNAISLLRAAFDRGSFGDRELIRASKARQLRGLEFLGVDTPIELLHSARDRNVDVLLLARLKTVTVGLNRKQDIQMSLNVIETASGKELWASKPLSSVAMAARRPGADPSTGVIDGLTKYVQENLRCEATLDLSKEAVVERGREIIARSHDDPLPGLAELAYYQRSGLLDSPLLAKAMTAIVGAADASVLLTGSEAARHETLKKWLPAAKPPGPAGN